MMNDRRWAQSHARRDFGDAFLPDPNGGPAHTVVDIAEALAEHFVASATFAQEHDQGDWGEDAPEEMHVYAADDEEPPRS